MPVGQAIVSCGLSEAQANTMLYYRRRLPRWVPADTVVFIALAAGSLLAPVITRKK
jgi:hypothetical protein